VNQRSDKQPEKKAKKKFYTIVRLTSTSHILSKGSAKRLQESLDREFGRADVN
jgi:hypothetical protein